MGAILCYHVYHVDEKVLFFKTAIILHSRSWSDSRFLHKTRKYFKSLRTWPGYSAAAGQWSCTVKP